ncbi:MAG: SRPBCC domain-containing protein [Nakamurella sp.]
MEYGSIEREFHVEAAPDVVFDVISSPVHIQQWWTAETDLEPEVGATGELHFGERGSPQAMSVAITVVDAQPPRLFSFRWVHPVAEVATATNSLLVTFELTPAGSGTTVRMTEVGFREIGWEAAVLEEAYREHVVGWDTYLPRIVEYVSQLVARP